MINKIVNNNTNPLPKVKAHGNIGVSTKRENDVIKAEYKKGLEIGEMPEDYILDLSGKISVEENNSELSLRGGIVGGLDPKNIAKKPSIDTVGGSINYNTKAYIDTNT